MDSVETPPPLWKNPITKQLFFTASFTQIQREISLAEAEFIPTASASIYEELTLNHRASRL